MSPFCVQASTISLLEAIEGVNISNTATLLINSSNTLTGEGGKLEEGGAKGRSGGVFDWITRLRRQFCRKLSMRPQGDFKQGNREG